MCQLGWIATCQHSREIHCKMVNGIWTYVSQFWVEMAIYGISDSKGCLFINNINNMRRESRTSSDKNLFTVKSEGLAAMRKAKLISKCKPQNPMVDYFHYIIYIYGPIGIHAIFKQSISFAGGEATAAFKLSNKSILRLLAKIYLRVPAIADILSCGAGD